jgi:hypothetical protein
MCVGSWANRRNPPKSRSECAAAHVPAKEAPIPQIAILLKVVRVLASGLSFIKKKKNRLPLSRVPSRIKVIHHKGNAPMNKYSRHTKKNLQSEKFKISTSRKRGLSSYPFSLGCVLGQDQRPGHVARMRPIVRHPYVSVR